jgi:hypothetical protein
MRSRSAKDCVSANAPPHHVWIAGSDLLPILEGRSAIRRPTHLPHPRMALYALDTKARAEVTTAREVGNELCHRLAEGALLLRG